MTVFEDLIVELQEENLLEETVISVGPGKRTGMFSAQLPEEHDFAELLDSDDPIDRTGGAASLSTAPDDSVRTSGRNSGLYTKGLEQISTYQTVEHILGGVERAAGRQEQAGFDELRTKKALHAVQHASIDLSSDELSRISAEFELQIAGWRSSLGSRDAMIPVAAMRRFCETCQPALSSQALFSLARFSRSLSFTEDCRGKYEFVVTRLFSRNVEGQKRTPICSKEEMLSHLRSRFSDSSESYSHLYSGDVDIEPFVNGFDEFSAEAETVNNFEEWMTSDYFERLNMFKEGTGEQFFVSDVTAAAILCNIKILNKLADLMEGERLAGNAENLIKKHGSTYDDVISDSIGRTFALSSIAGEGHVEDEAGYPETEAPRDSHSDDNRASQELLERKRATKAKPAKVEKSTRSFLSVSFAEVNKKLLVTTIIVVILSIGLYIWSDNYADSSAPNSNVLNYDLSNSEFKDLLKEGRISSDTFYAITQPAWDGLTRENQEEAVKKMFNTFSQKGCARVSLMNAKGQPAGFASSTRVEVFRP